MTIRSFGDSQTQKIFLGITDKKVAKFPQSLLKIARRKLDMIDAAAALEDLASSPGNRLHTLRGDLRGFHAINIDDQWMVVFKWETRDPAEVEIIDYH